MANIIMTSDKFWTRSVIVKIKIFSTGVSVELKQIIRSYRNFGEQSSGGQKVRRVQYWWHFLYGFYAILPGFSGMQPQDIAVIAHLEP